MRARQRSVASLVGAACLATAAAGRVTYTIDFHGPMMSFPDLCFAWPITEGDLLTAAGGFPQPGPMPPPEIVMFGGVNGPGGPDLGLPMYPGAFAHPPGSPGQVEVDALSFGRDLLLDPNPRPNGKPPFMPMWLFSVDEFAAGAPGGPPPDVFSEGALSAVEAAADIFTDRGLGFGPFPPPPPGAFGFNQDLFDGDGLPPFGGLGLGPFEPDPPTPAFLPDGGDNIDGVDTGILTSCALPIYPVFFSLDAAFLDPIEGPPVNSGSAIANGPYMGADVLVSFGPGAPPMVYAFDVQLGLDLAFEGADDLDALILHENGDGIYQPSQQPFDWVGGGTDMLIFSVRRGSFVIGAPDSISGAPIEEGDLLVPPVAGGVSQFPGILIPAEDLGLLTMRSGIALPFGFADDLDAADLVQDCNQNGVPDWWDIDTGTSRDVNGNGIPDECDCISDLSGDGVVNSNDLFILLGFWGTPAADLDGDGTTNSNDLFILLGAWGPCP